MQYTSKSALLGGIIDYAGTFPPAALPLAGALEKAAAFRGKGKHPWLLGKVVVPMAELKHLAPGALFGAGADGSAWLLTALGKTAEKGDEAFLRAIEWDLREIRHYNERGFDGPVRTWVVAYETKLPPEAVSSGNADDAFDYLAPVLDRFSDLTRSRLDPYFEIGLEGDWKRGLSTALEAFSQWCEDDQEGRVVPGIKVRTGGDKQGSAEQVAEVIAACAKYRFRFKATQGLHHAITRAGAFGFVNVFAAMNFAESLGPDKFGRESIRRCLEDEAADHFVFGAEAMSWMDQRLTLDAIESARKRHGASFGSCSLDEPDEALAKEIPA